MTIDRKRKKEREKKCFNKILQKKDTLIANERNVTLTVNIEVCASVLGLSTIANGRG
jgi:hypothetical protein